MSNPLSKQDNTCLLGVRIAMLRPQMGQGIVVEDRLSVALIQAGAQLLHAPLQLLESTPAVLPYFAADKHYIACVWISPAAVHFARQRYPNWSPPAWQFAVGRGSLAALAHYGLQAIVPCLSQDSAGLLALPRWQCVQDEAWLLIGGTPHAKEPLHTLQQRGAQVDFAACYQRKWQTIDWQALLTCDVFILSSATACDYLHKMASKSTQALLQSKVFVLHHPHLFARAAAFGWRICPVVDLQAETVLTALTAYGLLNDDRKHHLKPNPSGFGTLD